MKEVLTAAQMKNADRATMEQFGMPSCVLMERAALSVFTALMERKTDVSKVTVLCGAGNNGGDGFALARMLLQKNSEVTVLFVGNPEKMTVECKRQSEIYLSYCKILNGSYRILQPDGKIYRAEFDNDKEMAFIESEPDFETLKLFLKEQTLIADALFGIGLTRPVEGIFASVIEAANASEAVKVAIDIPSGISADDGKILGSAFCADLTITFGFFKRGQLLYPGREICGETLVTDIGIDLYSLKASLAHAKEKVAFSYDSSDLAKFPKRRADSNKGSYGKVWIYTGAKNMAGAGVFAGSAAYHTGAGLVYIFTEECNREIVQKGVPEAVLRTFDPTAEVTVPEEMFRNSTVLVAGPGIGKSEVAAKILRQILQKGDVPLVIDADGLNLLAEDKIVTTDMVINYPGDVILTPHLAEAARLLSCKVSEVQADLFQAAKKIAEKYHAVCVLKDASTLVVNPSGDTYINVSGNNGMSTGGSGDVLSGIIGGLLAQHADTYEAACLGVYLHGLAGNLAADKFSTYGMTAQDISNCIRDVLVNYIKQAEEEK